MRCPRCGGSNVPPKIPICSRVLSGISKVYPIWKNPRICVKLRGEFLRSVQFRGLATEISSFFSERSAISPDTAQGKYVANEDLAHSFRHSQFLRIAIPAQYLELE